ncbi:hypothetical protein HH682_03150 [Rosenbergiella sp. S61]|uniref:Uncharacterized protein n=1 Tax=Rosenbergiella gaditana TaxID=2726987 RepID=A0ABS5STN4_9GAMM|nr:hypothetical protein [Rosenbergiella gaditana]MBT0723455.1 hypothetical protein [Rosenbergiella gaditana]
MNFTSVDYDFASSKTLSDYGIEASKEFPFKSVGFDGNVLRLVASDVVGGELIIHTDVGTQGNGLKLKVKNAKGNATTGGNALISNEYVDTTTVGNGDVIIFVRYGETFDFTGYSLING